MNQSWLLPSGSDRYFRHQLAFEVAGAFTLAALTRRWDLVAFAGMILLPAVRSTWVALLRTGNAFWPVMVACVLVAPRGLPAIAAAWSVGCLVGALCSWKQTSATSLTAPRDPGGRTTRPR